MEPDFSVVLVPVTGQEAVTEGSTYALKSHFLAVQGVKHWHRLHSEVVEISSVEMLRLPTGHCLEQPTDCTLYNTMRLRKKPRVLNGSRRCTGCAKITSPALCSPTAFLGSERQDWDCVMPLLHKGTAKGALAVISFYCTTEVEIGESSVFVQLGCTRGCTELTNRLGGKYYSDKVFACRNEVQN